MQLGAEQEIHPWKRAYEKLHSRFGLDENAYAVVVDVSLQCLYLIRGDSVVHTYPVSTSKFGVGNRAGSNQTPLGTHQVCEKIGEGAEKGDVFRARQNTGEIAVIHEDRTDVEVDEVTTRILRLTGLEEGVNRGEGIDSYERFIYIHGTPEEGLIGTPSSHGCIRMKNTDVMELFDLVPEGILVEIQE